MKKIILVKFLILLISLISAGQNSTRPVVIVGKSPTPHPTATVFPTPSPAPRPTATATPTVTPTPAPVQTLSELQAKIRLSSTRYDIRRGSIGIKIVSLDTGKVVYEENAEKYFMPASNMKNFTVAAALEKLSPDFRFITSVFATSRPDANGVLKGDLTIYGRGDVSFSTAFHSGDYYKSLDELADKIIQAGVKRIEGNLIGDESYFNGSAIPPSWEWDDLQWYYGAEVSALPFNDNTLDLRITPSSVGSPCLVSLLPSNPVMRVINNCLTTTADVKRDLTVKKALEQNVLQVSGTMPVGDRGFANPITVSRPAELFIALLRQRLEKKGVVITGGVRVIGAKEKISLSNVSTITPLEIARRESPPLSLIAAKTMKPSQNLYTETLLWTLGEQLGDKTNPKATSAERGIGVVRKFLDEIGVASDSIIQWDGSGLSRHNLITPAANITLYSYMAKQSRYSSAWLDSLTIGGVDGTLKNRFKEAKTFNNVRGKTGTIDQVSALSGYVTTAAGEKVVFSIIINGVNDGRLRVEIIDEIVTHLATFDGKLN